ncbi:MAG TPA: response regulator transcription factor [Terriglobales bacterium]|nr:response regulator transcription factor [Terriglobales bacterium]
MKNRKGGRMITKQTDGRFPAKKKAVLVVDDHPIVRQGLTLLINQEPDLVVCGAAEEMHAALSAIGTLSPDILIVDISLSGPDGLELLKHVRLRSPHLPVLILSMHDESIYAERALRAGANGYIMKQEATEKVLVALRRILSGDIYVSDKIASSMLHHYVRGSMAAGRSSITELTDRELEVFRLIGEGQGTRQIADKLHLSVKTVESYQAHIKEKLSLRSARELVQHAVQWNVSEKSA